MKIHVVGAGAMGCLYAAAFHRGGAEVTLVDINQPHLDAINGKGLTVETRAGTEVLPLPAMLPQEVEGPSDLVLLFTKTFHTDSALGGIARLLGPDTHVLTLQNGLGNDERVARHVARERVLLGTSAMPSDLVGPGHIRSMGEGYSKLFPAFTQDSAFASQVIGLLEKGGMSATLDTNIHAAVWSKAIFNAAMNPLCALTRRTPGFFLKHAESRELVREAVNEGTMAGRAHNIPIEAKPIHDLTLVSMTDHADHEASMLQDIKAGRRTEVDAINGAIVQAGREAGVATPVLETLWRLVKLEEAKLAEG